MAIFGAYSYLCALTIILNPQIALGRFVFFLFAFFMINFLYLFLKQSKGGCYSGQRVHEVVQLERTPRYDLAQQQWTPR